MRVVNDCHEVGGVDVDGVGGVSDAVDLLASFIQAKPKYELEK